MISGAVIATCSGGYFSFADPASTPVAISDIARGLANLCRYGGQINRFYSVAEHSVHASYLVPSRHAYAALMHDAGEALTGDMVKPLKEVLPDFQEVEARVEQALFTAYAVPQPLPEAVKTADLQMLILEKEQLKGNYDQWSWCAHVPRPPHRRLECWTPDEAYARFMERFSELYGLHGQGPAT